MKLGLKILVLFLIGIFPSLAFQYSEAFEYSLYDGFFIEYGTCELTVESADEFLESVITQIMKEQYGDSCDLLERAKFEYDYTAGNAIWTNKITDSKSTPITFLITDDDENLNIVLPENWQKGDSLKIRFGTITEVEYNGVKEIEINDKSLQVYEFVGEAFRKDPNLIVQLEARHQYDVSSGFLVSSYYQIKMAMTVGIQTFGATAELLFNALNISEPPIISQITSAVGGQGGCLIATATYDSELAPKVQLLREIRDNTLLQTESGSNFMAGFNQFYYSFSPTIADWERQNPVFKEAVKLTITPLLSSLYLLNYVDIDSEVEVLGYGISLLLLNIGMYFVLPASIIHRVRKFV